MGQMADSASASRGKKMNNVIKLNLTSWILYSSGIQLSYERVLSPKRSITIFGGYIQFPMPTVIENSTMQFDLNKAKSGFVIGSEYHFYLKKENKYDAPHGVYLAPFVSYYHFKNQRSGRDTLTNDKLTLNSTLDFLNIGGEIGYQFIINKHLSIDCVMFGPAVSSYYFGVKLDGSTSGNHSEKLQQIIDALKKKYPLLNDLSKGETVTSNGVSNFWALGFRYTIQIGWRF